MPLATRIANVFRWTEVEPSPLPTAAPTGLAPVMEAVWQRHVVQNRLGARLLRAATAVTVTLLLTGAIVLAFHEPRVIPQRGEVALFVHEVLHVLVFLMLYFVVFFVADAAALCVTFVGYLRRPESVWPTSTIRHFEKKLGFADARLVDHWIDMQFLAQRTKAINHLVYYPFVMLSLVLLSRSPAFDDWTMPTSGKILSAIGALIALLCAMALRQAAERTRRSGLAAVEFALMQANGRPGCAETEPGPCAPTPRQLEILRDHMVKLDRGAFATYTQQPLLKAIMLPFATLGGQQLLEYLRLANL
jgi:hypothetical protein